MANFKLSSFKEQQKLWLKECPYASLFLISCVGEINLTRLIKYIAGFTALDIISSRNLSAKIIRMLQRNGHIFEVNPNLYSALPPYAIQRGLEEWLILGDARVDTLLNKEVTVFQINYSTEDENEINFDRLLLVESRDEERLFQQTQIRPFMKDDLINLFQDAREIVEPITWPGYEPSPCDCWEEIDDRGRWIRANSQSNIQEGLCRGVNVDQEGNVVFEKYYFRHEDGWSPLTSDEAKLWTLKMAALSGTQFQAKYLNISKLLIMPLGIPSSAYVALRYVGTKAGINNDKLFVENVESDIAHTICKRMYIKLIEEEG